MSDIIYRYRSIDDHTIEGLKNNEFYFSSPKEFNDPFDCKSKFTFRDCTDADWKVFFNRLLKEKKPTFWI